jgi:integrase/recombinase XerD
LVQVSTLGLDRRFGIIKNRSLLGANWWPADKEAQMSEYRFLLPPGPLAPYASGWWAFLIERGHTEATARRRLTQLCQLSRWLEAEGFPLAHFDEALAARFALARRARGRATWSSPANSALLLKYLRSVGAVAPRPAPVGAFEDLLAAYSTYLARERGLATKTVAAHVVSARAICNGLAGGPEGLKDLRPEHITALVMTFSAAASASTTKHMVGSLSSFLRYLHLTGFTARPLAAAVPKLKGRRPGPQPPSLTEAEVARLLGSCRAERPVGRRDFAILALLSRLGLRPCEVAALCLSDIDWRHGEVLIRGKGSRYERLPLPWEAGEAVAGYLAEGRQQGPDGCRAVFLRSRAPFTPLGLAGVQAVVVRASERAGLGKIGPRRLRKYVATAVHKGGFPLAGVGQVLRHTGAKVSAVYVDLDEAVLAGLARPWPGNGR